MTPATNQFVVVGLGNCGRCGERCLLQAGSQPLRHQVRGVSRMLDEDLLPSAEAESVLRNAGWSPSRKVDISAWVEALRSEGNEVSPLAEAILRRFGGLVIR